MSTDWALELRRLKEEVDNKLLNIDKNRQILEGWKYQASDEIGAALNSFHPCLMAPEIVGVSPQNDTPADDLMEQQSRLTEQISKLLHSVSQVAGGPPAPLSLNMGDNHSLLAGWHVTRKGVNVRVSGDGQLAIRIDPRLATQNTVYGDAPIPVGSRGAYAELVVKRVSKFSGVAKPSEIDGLTVGVTLTSPSALTKLPDGCWKIPSSWFVGFNGQTLENEHSWSLSDRYHPAELKAGDKIGIFIPSSGQSRGTMLLYVNGKLRVRGPQKIPVDSHQLFLVIDLLGTAEAVTLASSSSVVAPVIPDLSFELSEPSAHRKHPTAWGRAGSNITLASDGTLALKKTSSLDFGNICLANGPMRRFKEVWFYSVRVKKMKPKTPHKLLLGVTASLQPPALIPPVLSDLSCHVFDLSPTTWKIKVGDTLGFLIQAPKIVLFINGRFKAEKTVTIAAEDIVFWPIISIDAAVEGVSLMPDAEPPAESDFEMARYQATMAAIKIQRFFRSRKIREKWRKAARVLMMRAGMKKEADSTGKVEKLLEQQLILQHRLLEKIEKIANAPAANLTASNPFDFGKLQVSGRIGTASDNLKVDSARGSAIRTDEFKAWLEIEGFSDFTKLEVTCDKKTLGMCIGFFPGQAPSPNAEDLPFSVCANLNGDVKNAQNLVDKVSPRPIVDAGSIEISITRGVAMIVISGKLLTKMTVPPAARSLGIEFWGGARAVAIAGERRGSLSPSRPVSKPRKYIESPAKVQPSSPPEPKAKYKSLVKKESPPSVSGFSGSVAADKSDRPVEGSVMSDASGSVEAKVTWGNKKADDSNFLEAVLDFMPADLFGASSSDSGAEGKPPEIRGKKASRKS